MCGILVASKVSSEDNFLRALKRLDHRGPDEHHIVRDDDLFLGHTRLSIIGVENGKQPIQWNDGEISLLVNGELYDHERIRRDLENEGVHFETSSDSEIMLHLYRRQGLGMMSQIRGEFAAVIVDRNKQELHCIRDRFGIKPLFYHLSKDGQLVVASEQKAIFALGRLSPELDPNRVRDALSAMNPPSFFKGIEVVPPRHVLSFSLEESISLARTHKYWSLDFPVGHQPGDDDLQAAATKLRRKLTEAIQLRLRSDVPLGVFLSGGLDSTAIAAITRELLPKQRIKAFTVAFTDQEKFNELDQARETARDLNLDLHVAEITAETMLKEVESYIWHTESPSPNFHGVGKYVLSHLARQHVKVVLTGEGSDEVFLGYDFFRQRTDNYLQYANEDLRDTRAQDDASVNPVETQVRAKLGFMPLGEHRQLLHPFTQGFFKFIFHRRHRQKLDAESALDRLVKDFSSEAEIKERPALTQSQIYVIRQLLENYNLTQLGDRPEMAHSIEGRQPFLDHHLFELCRNFSTKIKINSQRTKIVLREAVKDIVPPAVYKGQKWPFMAPTISVHRSHSPKMKQLIDTYLAPKAVKELGVFNMTAIRLGMLFVRYGSCFEVFTYRINCLLSFILMTQIAGIQMKRSIDKTQV